jgi:hypothetical protein
MFAWGLLVRMCHSIYLTALLVTSILSRIKDQGSLCVIRCAKKGEGLLIVLVACLHCNLDVSTMNKTYACLQMLNCHATSSMNAERERAYDIVKEQAKLFSFWMIFLQATTNELSPYRLRHC